MNRIRRLLPSVILLVLLVCASGCVGRKVVLVPPGEPVQLAEPVRAYIYVNGERSAGRVTLPQGWWVLPDPDPD